MALLLPILLVLGVIVLANAVAAAKNPQLNTAFDRLMLLLSIPLAMTGLMLALLPENVGAQLVALEDFPLTNVAGTGLVLFLLGLWTLVVSLKRVRLFLQRWMSIDPGSPVHTLALVLSGFLVGNTMLTLTQGGLTELAASAGAASIAEVVLQQGFFALIALFGAGLLIRRGGDDLSARLGLERLNSSHVRWGLRWIAILVIIQWLIGLAWALLNPEQSALLEGINSELLGDFDTVWEWFALALAAGMGEELLFRGALQPVLGIWATSLLFAIAHVQYGFTLVTLAVFIIGAALGYIRQRTNTTVAIFVHFGYNFVLGLLALLATYLEQFVS
ncbi:MAG: CPBP family intramembrane metalloprotease [Anaerolineales bacterium]|nr:CPBP family intramembrane metalloprotease [Anaerolineales bacterium]